MRLDTEFYKLPLRFDPERLAAEVLQFREDEWCAHPQAYPGNSAIPLISVGGGINDEVRGPMKPTPFLERCPYLQQILAAFGMVVGRSRLMRIAGGSTANAHVDASYYWRHHVRVHVPAVTYPEVQFLCGERAVNMAAGEAWLFDSWKLHDVINPITAPRIHFVADTVGSAHFWDDLVARAERPFDSKPKDTAKAVFMPFVEGKEVTLALETRNFPVVMTPWEQESLAASMFSDLEDDAAGEAQALISRTQTLHREWFALWTRFGDSRAGWESFGATLSAYDAFLETWRKRLALVNGMDLVEALRHAIVRPALTPQVANEETPSAQSAPAALMRGQPAPEIPSAPERVLERPVFIVSAPRSGSTMLFELLARSPGFTTTGGESHGLIEGIAALNPAQRNFASNRLTEGDAGPATASELRARFLARLRTADGSPPVDGHPVRMLEKTPKNALRIPFLRAVFPDALFVYLYREPQEGISSILEAWRSGKFVTYPRLPGWSGPAWSLALIPGWRELDGKELAEIAARQWTEINARIIADLEAGPRAAWTAVSYAEVLADPQAAAARLCAFASVAWTETVSGPLPPSRYTLTPPAPDKWRANEAEIAPFLPLAEPVAAKARTLLEHSAAAPPPADAPAVELTSVHTSNLPELLTSLGISLLVTTYQAGRLIIVREQAGTLNTHFRSFASPMGLAYDGARLAIGTKRQVWQFINQVDVAPKLEPRKTHDAAFLPRSCYHTGDIRIHEMAYANSELWAVNTRFSCLCSFDADHSFVPRWRPPFVSALAPEDRCHLNGLAVVEGTVKYVTCLGLTNTAGGWRENKARGGSLLEVPSGEVIATGLSMPHSPRLYNGHLWILESGEGTLSRVDPKTGKAEAIVRLPGFTRGLDFFGPFAFIGLSQVRETAIFSGLPLTDRLPPNDRTCGVWVVDLRSGETAAFLRFESGVQEIFSVQVLAGIRQPDVVIDDEDLLESSFVIPEGALAEVPRSLLAQKDVSEISDVPEHEKPSTARPRSGPLEKQKKGSKQRGRAVVKKN